MSTDHLACFFEISFQDRKALCVPTTLPSAAAEATKQLLERGEQSARRRSSWGLAVYNWSPWYFLKFKTSLINRYNIFFPDQYETLYHTCGISFCYPLHSANQSPMTGNDSSRYLTNLTLGAKSPTQSSTRAGKWRGTGRRVIPMFWSWPGHEETCWEGKGKKQRERKGQRERRDHQPIPKQLPWKRKTEPRQRASPSQNPPQIPQREPSQLMPMLVVLVTRRTSS